MYPRLNLNYRLDGLCLATDNSLFLGIDRNSLQPDGNQTCRILNTGVNAKDILGQRLNEWSTSTTYGRSTNRNNSFRNMSYVMCHLIYRFSIGKKAD